MTRAAGTDYDLVVLGGGSAGVRCARVAAELGARVVLIESHHLGGTCVNVGCIPKKLFTFGARYAQEVRDARGFGWDIPTPTLDWTRLVARVQAEITRLQGVYARLLDKAGVERVRGVGRLTGPHEVQVADRALRATHLVVATGGRPWVPELPGRELPITSDDVFTLPERPRRLVVVGGGYIAAELATAFRGFGSEVHLVCRGDMLLRGFDRECRQVVQDEIAKLGVQLHPQQEVRAVERVDGSLRVHLTADAFLEADQVLCATGRRPNTAGLGLEALGVALSPHGAVRVDERYRSSVPSIHAIGDVIDRVTLTPVALAEGTVLARNLFGPPEWHVDYRDIPTTVFTHPALATVGLTEEEAAERHGPIRVYVAHFRPLKHAVSGRDTKTFMKLVVEDRADRVVGCHIVGEDAGEMVQLVAVAMKGGATKAQFDATLGIHPTVAEELVTMRKARAPA